MIDGLMVSECYAAQLVDTSLKQDKQHRTVAETTGMQWHPFRQLVSRHNLSIACNGLLVEQT